MAINDMKLVAQRTTGFLLAATVHACIIGILTVAVIATFAPPTPQPIPEPLKIEIGEQELSPPEMSPEEPVPEAFTPPGADVETPMEDEIPANPNSEAMLQDIDEPPPEDITKSAPRGLAGDPDRSNPDLDERKRFIEGPKEDGIPKLYGIPIEGNTVFLLDMSGSMGEKHGSSTRLGTVLVETIQAIRTLGESDTFDVVAFSGSYADGTKAWQGTMVPASGTSRDSAIRWLYTLVPAGGTPTHSALQWASLKYGPAVDNLVLITDGVPDYGTEGAILADIRAWMGRFVDASLVCISVGSDGLPFVKRLVDRVDGTYVEVK